MAPKNFYPKGGFVFREGESADYAYVLKEGSVEILKTSADGDLILATLSEPNTIFGEMALIDGAPRSASARASVDSKVDEVKQDAFLKYIAQKPNAALNIMKQLSTQLRDANKAVSNAGSSLEEDLGEMVTDIKQVSEDVDDTDAIYDSPASKPVMLTLGAVLTAFVVAFVFATSLSVDTTVSARGKFTAEVPNVGVQSTSSATVRKLFVKRGQRVKEGEMIVLLDSTAADSDLKGNDDKLAAVNGRLRRLKLEQQLIENDGSVPGNHGLSPLALDILQKKVGQYRSKMSSFNSKLAKIEKEVIKAKNDVISAEKTVKITMKQYKLKKRIESAKKELFDKKVGSMLSYLQAQDATLAASRANLGASDTVDAKKSALSAKLSDKGTLQADLDEFVAKWSSGLGENISKEQEQFAQLTQSALKLKQNVDNIEVRAPAEGVVLEVPTISQGSIVREGDVLVTLVLSNQKLAFEVDVDPKDISDVKKGAGVSVKLDALPFQQYGDIKGTLTYLSDDAYTESLSGEKGSYYRGRVSINAEELSTLPSTFTLTSGMGASADLKVGERKIITYLTHPILKGLSSAFSEPD
ncbi:MAG: HlyD family type I secretion periplasmic adaptor subunit [Rhodospirillales bacterium]|nr:HlyD family type I secretion periplasmic adaptor subunit [Rhodospirillales bacterium]